MQPSQASKLSGVNSNWRPRLGGEEKSTIEKVWARVLSECCLPGTKRARSDDNTILESDGESFELEDFQYRLLPAPSESSRTTHGTLGNTLRGPRNYPDHMRDSSACHLELAQGLKLDTKVILYNGGVSQQGVVLPKIMVTTPDDVHHKS